MKKVSLGSYLERNRNEMNRKRNLFVDIAKAVSISFVIILHTQTIDSCNPLYIFILGNAVPIFMFLSGFTFGMGNVNRKIKDYFNHRYIVKKLVRYASPAIVAFSVYLLISALYSQEFGVMVCLQKFLLGDYGPGSYYFMLLFQMIFLLPIFGWLIRKYDIYGLTIIGLCNFMYELLCSYYAIDTSIYRIIVLRYAFYIALGIYIGLFPQRRVKYTTLISSMAFGIFYLLLPSYWNYSYRVFTFDSWARTSMASAFYVVPVLYILLQIYNKRERKNLAGVCSVMEMIGQASYHIMYTQMIYFSGISSLLFGSIDDSSIQYEIDSKFISRRIISFLLR